MKTNLLIALLTFSTISLLGQQTDSIAAPKTLENQFDKIYRISTTYQEYKVISQEGYLNLKKGVLDSLKATKQIISSKNQEIATQNNTIANLNNTLNETKTKLDTVLIKENTVSIFDFKISKTTYHLILWGLVGLFLILTIYFLYKFNNSNVFTKEAKELLREVEEEFEEFRKKTLVKEQKLRRQLQDEINKQK